MPLDAKPDPERGNIYVEEGFAHVYADRAHAMAKLGRDQGHPSGETIVEWFRRTQGTDPPLHLSHFATCPNASAHRG